jgi:hypothetical protein
MRSLAVSKSMELIHDIACLAAAKTIINEVKQDLPEESPILWTMQAFTVAAAVGSGKYYPKPSSDIIVDHIISRQFQSYSISSRA